ncbi:DUF7560 family zinc ribbon protein [Halovenus marina]|uniref:DUF7560 family zinc ribbon protein n=1 Tax=Halovenus marina TaxID=3396621 RepID=UPI003F54F514
MAGSVRGTREEHRYMKEHEFTCSECGQQITVNEGMREAIVSSGCPVCGAAATDAQFAPIDTGE